MSVLRQSKFVGRTDDDALNSVGWKASKTWSTLILWVSSALRSSEALWDFFDIAAAYKWWSLRSLELVAEMCFFGSCNLGVDESDLAYLKSLSKNEADF